MDLLIIVNALFTGYLFIAWSKDGFNFVIKCAIMTLFIFNFLRLAGKV